MTRRAASIAASLLVAILCMGTAGCAARSARSSGDATARAEPGIMTSIALARDVSLTASLEAPHWAEVPGLYRIAGPEPRTFYAWQPTGQRNFHVPEAFGTLRLQ